MPLLNLSLVFLFKMIVFEDMAWHDSVSCHVMLCYVKHVFLDKYTHVKSIISKEKDSHVISKQNGWRSILDYLIWLFRKENESILLILHRESVLWFGYKSNARSYEARWKCLSYSMRDPNGLFAVVFISIAYNPLLLLIFQLDPVSCWILIEWILSNLKNCHVMMRRYLRSESTITCKTLCQRRNFLFPLPGKKTGIKFSSCCRSRKILMTTADWFAQICLNVRIAVWSVLVIAYTRFKQLYYQAVIYTCQQVPFRYQFCGLRDYRTKPR